MTIRPYRQTDRRRVREICIRTADDSVPFTTIEERPGHENLLANYCDYYIDCEPESCFVLADENDEAVGYVLCAREHKPYAKRFVKEYTPRVVGTWKNKLLSYGEAIMHGVCARKYPAHLHIDILPGYRGGGNGTKMIATLLEHLKLLNVKGVHLIVSEGNPNAIRFYSRCGFKTLLKFGKGRIMGKLL